MKIEEVLFKEVLKEEDLVKVRRISKGDVHNHYGLGMRFSTLNVDELNEMIKKSLL